MINLKVGFTLAGATHVGMPQIHAKEGFTLAEILVTLGIIGLVAAMTIPQLITNMTTREMESRFKIAYSRLNQMSKSYEAESGMAIPVGVRSGESMKVIFSKHLKGFSNVNGDSWTSKDEDGKPTGDVYKKYKNFQGLASTQVCDISGTYVDISGIQYMWNDNPAAGQNGPIICVDLNGSAKPNISGIDYFLFIPTVEGNVIPMGMEHPDNSTSTSIGVNFFQDKSHCGKNGNYSCAYWAVTNTSPKGYGRYWQDYIRKKQF